MPLRPYLFSPSNSSADGTALNTSTAETSILAPNDKFTIPANEFEFVGKKFEVILACRVSTVVTTAKTLTIRLKFGAVSVVSTGAMDMSISSIVDRLLWLHMVGECRSIGSGTSATIFGCGIVTSQAVIASGGPTTAGVTTHTFPYNAAPAVGTGFDSTAGQQVDMTGQWSASAATTTSIQKHLFSWKWLN